MTTRDLLAVIHGDGGHHTAAVGLRQSIKDAAAEFYRLRTVNSASLEALEECVHALSYQASGTSGHDACLRAIDVITSAQPRLAQKGNHEENEQTAAGQP